MRRPLILAALVVLPACSTGDHANDTADRPRTASGDSLSPVTLGPGDIRIMDTGGQIDLALVGDTVSAGLAPSVLAKARRQMDTAPAGRMGVGASIARMVKRSVSTGLATRSTVPLSAIRDVRYTNGRIVFERTEGSAPLFEHADVNGQPLLERFRPEDAQRFVDAVRARKRARGGP